MLAHLDKNRLTLKGTVRQSELYALMIALAGRELSGAYVPRRVRERTGAARHGADHQVGELTAWLAARVDPVRRGERQITYRQLRTILRSHGFELELKSGNKADVIRVVERPKRLIRRGPVTEHKRIGTVGYHSEGETVSTKVLKQVRRMTKLTEEEGCDSNAFYEGADMVDTFVNRYRTVLRRLSKT
jgi:hypothetical protein